jgi:tetratricopeptide (TPR) repeat protein
MNVNARAMKCLLAAGWLGIVCPAQAEPGLALQLVAEKDFRSAAVEWRRLSLDAAETDQRAGYLWAAAYAYWRAEAPESAERMLDEAESMWTGIEEPALLLRARVEEQRRDWAAAGFYWAGLEREAGEDAVLSALALRHRAAVEVRQERVAEAIERLRTPPPADPEALAALERFAAGRDKRPMVGGLLGLIPGMGYAYAGEYANAFRSVVLNALFIYGMVDTAQNDHWGGFAAITFFEITWYTGSVYGGIDASHRYNQRRRDDTVEALIGDLRVTPRWDALPVVSLQYFF